MTAANLVVLVLWGLAPEPTAGALVEQLGSARYVEREAATVALQDLGPEALPALQAARDSNDPEVRSRAAALRDRIESNLIVQATLVKLDYRNRPLMEVLADLGRRSGMVLRFGPSNAEDWRDRRITLQADRPLPFWQAMDRLCQVAQLQHNLTPRPFSDEFEEPGPGLFLFDAERVLPSRWNSDSGPFRVSALSVHHSCDIPLTPQFGGGGDAPMNADEQFRVQLQVMAEPRLMISQSGPLRLLEAVDDLGQSLLIESGLFHEDSPSMTEEVFDGFSFSPGALVQTQAELKYPDRPGRSIRRLRGVVPILVAARRPEPLVIPLAESSGKTFRAEEVSFLIHSLRPDPVNDGTILELTIRSGGSEPSPIPVPGGPATLPGTAGDLSLQALESQIEIVDAQEKVLPWSPESLDLDGSAMRLTLMVPTAEGGGHSPARLRYFSLIRAQSSATFDLHDIPMPGH